MLEIFDWLWFSTTIILEPGISDNPTFSQYGYRTKSGMTSENYNFSLNGLKF